MPVFGMLERLMMKKFNIPPGKIPRLIIRSAYVGENFDLFYFPGKLKTFST